MVFSIDIYDPNRTIIVPSGSGHAHFEIFFHGDDLLNRGLRVEGKMFHSLNEKKLLMSRKIFFKNSVQNHRFSPDKREAKFSKSHKIT
jgi:hypothetical protein